MADEKSIVKMNKMIHKRTGESFFVVYVIYVSLVYTDSKKTSSCLLPDTPSLQLLEGNSNAYLYAYRAVYICSIMFWTI